MKPQISQNFFNSTHRLISSANTSTQPNEASGRRAAKPNSINTGVFCGLFSRKHLSKEERDAFYQEKVEKEWPKTVENWEKSNISQYHKMQKPKEKEQKKLRAKHEKADKAWKQVKKYNIEKISAADLAQPKEAKGKNPLLL
ncbi:hypothetical protein KQH49_08120 [Mycetohabitans sp. B5]|uniref:Uncharacterized protein n=1 Tax=Mycetohabitans endofungorum TaxID=417203 RepID=A0A2P5KAP1_9BURK|nr:MULTISPECIES: hypothetical protein [Mycetohabitans]MCG1054918.1 hypothetical protein [Mycetohabitans sp. B5]PPB83781.1 hypothetical protein B0O95_106172 [Mycetohabitans endofungorum]